MEVLGERYGHTDSRELRRRGHEVVVYEARRRIGGRVHTLHPKSVPLPVELGAVTWPASTVLVSEVQTGGDSASDEFAEITNAGGAAIDLAGLELVYVTSTGTTVTRKASWATTQLLAPVQHLYVANSAGIFASLADATYSGGFAATGGAIVLRAIGGAPVDAVGWGDATNAFVEEDGRPRLVFHQAGYCGSPPPAPA